MHCRYFSLYHFNIMIFYLRYGRAGTVVGHGSLTLNPAAPHTKGLEGPGWHACVVVCLYHPILRFVITIHSQVAPTIEVGATGCVIAILAAVPITNVTRGIVLGAVDAVQRCARLVRVLPIAEKEFERNFNRKFGYRLW